MNCPYDAVRVSNHFASVLYNKKNTFSHPLIEQLTVILNCEESAQKATFISNCPRRVSVT